MSLDRERATGPTPWWFWIFGVLLLLVTLAGVAQLPLQFLASEADQTAQMSPETLAIMRAEPWWATAGYTTALLAGLGGAICLLLPRARRLVPLILGIAIAGLVLQRAWFFLLSDLTHLLPRTASVSLFTMVAVYLVAIWLARRAVRLAPTAVRAP